MEIVILQRLSNQPERTHVLTRLIDSETGELLDETGSTYVGYLLDDVVSVSQSEARQKAKRLGGSRFFYDTKVS